MYRRDLFFGWLVVVFFCLAILHNKYSLGEEAQIIRTIVYNQITDFDTDLGIGRLKISANGSKIIFSTTNKKIFTINTDGTNLVEVFDFATFREGCPCLSPFVDISADGSKIIWTDTGGEIFIANSDGSNQLKIADVLQRLDGGTVDPDITKIRLTADASQVFFTNELSGGPEVAGVWRVNADGSGLTQLFSSQELSALLDGNTFIRISWGGISDDGSRMVFSIFSAIGSLGGNDRNDIITFDGSLRRLFDFGAATSGSIAISGDGGKIVLRPSSISTILSMDFDGNNQIELASDLGLAAPIMQMTPDGTQVILRTATFGTPLIPLTLFNTDGSAQLYITT